MKTGLVLSGGGFRGLAHVGILKALDERGITPSYIAGTSAGAIVGALFASGLKWNEILSFFKKVDIFSFRKFALNKPGWVDTEKFYEEFAELFTEDSFESLKIPLYITATNILEGSLRIFSSGPLIKPLLASAAFPGMFTPVIIDKNHYVDGGVLNNFPVDLIKEQCDQIIGAYVNPFTKVTMDDLKYSYNVLERAYHIRAAKSSVEKFKDCDLLISPEDLVNHGTFTVKDMDAVFELGYKAAKESLEKDKDLVY